jgi:MFS family permease
LKFYFQGVLDMTTLFSLAITVSLLGSQVEKYGPKKILSLGLLILAGLTLLIGFCLFLKITSKILYFFVYGLTIGIISACGWPSCLSVQVYNN